MVRRLLLVLILVLAVPSAAAMPLCAAAPLAAQAHDEARHRPAHKQDHGRPADAHCIGCVAPATVRPPTIALPAPALAMIPAAVPATGIAREAPKPGTRPPQAG